jgi:F0F1-type ATP synthase assembly protein I
VGYEDRTDEEGERLIVVRVMVGVMVGVGLGYIVTDAI